MRRSFLLLALLFGSLAPAPFAAAEPPPEARQFDFWLGEWDVDLRIRQEDGSWPDTVAAEARIYPVLRGKAVLELWDSEPIKGFSLRYFDPARGKWFLWLSWPGENRSGSSGLEGSFHHGRGEFFRTNRGADGQETLARYTFSDITPTSLRWDDAFSTDGGKTWTHGWIMEFHRKAESAALAPDGGEEHTFAPGGRCTLPEFRAFEPLAGRRQGEVKAGDAAWEPAELTAYRILGGCAVLAFLRHELGGEPFESLHLLTYNTYAGVFEESALDSLVSTPLEVYYGSMEGEEGEISLTRAGRAAGAAGGRRHHWSLGEEGPRLRITTSEDGESWQELRSYRFRR